MSKKLISVIIAGVICIMAAVPAYAATKTYTYIESTSISLKYEDFKAGSTDDDSVVTVTLNGANGLYSVDSTAMSVPSGGWQAGDRPNLHVYLIVSNEDNTRFANSASRPSGVSVDNGEAHYGELKSSGRKVYYQIYLNEVQENDDDKWEDEKDWGPQAQQDAQTGPGAVTKGAWLKDPDVGRYWYAKADGTRYCNEWVKINDIWYFFDMLGYRVENQWIKWKGKDYYVGEYGRMYANERTPDGYWVGSDGAWDGKPKNK